MKRTVLLIVLFTVLLGPALTAQQAGRELTTLDRPSARAMRHYERALRQYFKHDYEGAIATAKDGLELEPEFVRLQWLLANIYQKAGRLGSMFEVMDQLAVRERMESEYVNELVIDRSVGYVLSSDRDRVTVDVSEAEGFEIGDRLVVYEEGVILTHPVTLEIVDVDRPSVGMVEIVDLRENYSIASIVDADIPIERGMRVIDEADHREIEVVDGMERGRRVLEEGYAEIALTETYDGSALSGAEGFFADSAGGRLFVADTGNDRVLRFSAQGDFEQAFGVTGGGEGQFRQPVSLAMVNGGLVVVDRANHRVQRVDPDSFEDPVIAGSRGIETVGLFTTPQKVVSDGDEVFVLDTGNNRLQVLDSELEFSDDTVTDDAVANSPVSFTLSDAAIYLLDAADGVLHEFQRDAPYNYDGARDLPDELQGRSIVDLHYFSSGGDDYIAFALDQDDEVVILNAETLSVAAELGGTGSQAGHFLEPVMLQEIDGELHVFERGNNRVQIISDFL